MQYYWASTTAQFATSGKYVDWKHLIFLFVYIMRRLQAWARLWLKHYIYLLQWDCGEVVRVDEGQIFSVWTQSSAKFCGLNLILQADNGVNSTVYCKTVEETFIMLIDNSCQHSSGFFYRHVFAVT